MDWSTAKCYRCDRDSYPCRHGHIPHALTNWANSPPLMIRADMSLGCETPTINLCILPQCHDRWRRYQYSLVANRRAPVFVPLHQRIILGRGIYIYLYIWGYIPEYIMKMVQLSASLCSAFRYFILNITILEPIRIVVGSLPVWI